MASKKYVSPTDQAGAKIGENCNDGTQLCEVWLTRGEGKYFRTPEKLVEVSGFFAMLAQEMGGEVKVMVRDQIYDSLEDAVASYGGQLPSGVEVYRLVPVSKAEIKVLKKGDVAFGYDQ